MLTELTLPWVTIRELSQVTLFVGDFDNRLFLESMQRHPVAILPNIDNDVYHKKLYDLWSHWIRLAYRHELQIFATTHSWECIEAFVQVLEEYEVAGSMVRLEHRDGQWYAICMDSTKSSIILRDRVEIR